jgi:hypothetical protein
VVLLDVSIVIKFNTETLHMLKKWLERINYGIIVVFVGLMVAAGYVQWQRPDVLDLQSPQEHKSALPKNSFAQKQTAYDQIGEPLLSLDYIPPRMQLPDLRQKLTYYGQNNRPDANKDSSMMHFNTNNQTVSAAPGQPLYLQYDRSGNAGTYRFSPNNKETSLWIEAMPEEKEASILVRMIDENGELVTSPYTNESFQLKEKEFTRFGGKPWEIGKWRVDGTLLARQRAKWFGVDRFLERHGGDEFQTLAGKNRIDFTADDDTYSVFVNEGSALVWNGEEWKEVIPGEESKGLPLLVVKKVDERLMNLELWDVEGKKKIALNLLKSMETWMPQNLQQDFKFLGARTRSQFVFEVDDEKMLLSPHDWLLLTDEGWKKLDTLDEIDDYVDLKDKGTLFVFDGVMRIGDQQMLKGAMYNATRTKVHDIELPVQKDGLVYQPVEKNRNKREMLNNRPNTPYANGQPLEKKQRDTNQIEKNRPKRPY